MTYTTGTLSDVTFFGGPILSQGYYRRAIPGAVFIGLGIVAAALLMAASLTMAVAWVIAASLTIDPDLHEAVPVAPKTIVRVNPYGTVASAADFLGSSPVLTDPSYAPDVTPDAEPAPSAAAPPTPDGAPPPLQKEASERAKSVPLPLPNPFFRPPHMEAKQGIARSLARRAGPQIAAAQDSTANSPPRDNRNPVQKFFDALKQPFGPVLTEARPEDGSISSVPPYNNAVSLPATDGRTAVYDIAAHVVYMPNGDRLEAHSGLGNRLDDPSHVNEKDRGATPPHAYDLELRRPLFHGVQALRLNPVDGGNIFGRTGLLAHSYMLGPNGASNGCVSFKDYREFLDAFLRGEVKRLVVVAHLGAAPSRAAPARRGHDPRYAFNNR